VKEAPLVLAAIAGLLDALFLAATIAFAVIRHRTRRSLARMAAQPTSRIADAPTTGLVELAGVAKPIDANVLEAPLSGTKCVWWRVQIDEVNGSSFNRVIRKSEACDFYVDDDSGALARVRARQAKVELKWRRQNLPDQKEGVRRFLDKHGIAKPLEGLVWCEEAVDVLSEVYVIGRASPPEASSTDEVDPYRGSGSPRERLVVDSPTSGDPLVISMGHEAALAKKLEDELARATSELKGFATFSAVASVVLAGLLIYGLS
jgi:hypothetical protein